MTTLSVDRTGLVMPSLIAAHDRTPDRPSPWDDEFDGELGTAWKSVTGWGAPSDVDKTIPSCVTFRPGAGSAGIFRLGLPATPFTMTARVAAQDWGGSLTPKGGGIGFAEATPGKLFYGPLDVADSDYMCIAGGYWTDPSTFSSNIGTWTTGGSASSSVSRVHGYAYSRPYVVKFVVNSATNIDGYISWGGGWQQWLSAYNPGFTMAGVIIFASAVAFAYDWVRFTTP